MYTYFSRILHHILSHSDEKPQPTSMLSYLGLTQISRWNKLANWFDLDTPIKSECDSMGTDASLKHDDDSLCTGRSMVEMLGVLAIIGVLSVGAISGYSKAMFKYKLNKMVDQYNQLFGTIIIHREEFSKLSSPTQQVSLFPIIYKMGELPDGMKPFGSNSFDTNIRLI